MWARETTQRVTRDIVEKDQAMFARLQETMNHLEEVFDEIQETMMSTLQQVDAVIDELQQRIAFHLDRGLGGAEFIAKHDFVRGFEVKFAK